MQRNAPILVVPEASPELSPNPTPPILYSVVALLYFRLGPTGKVTEMDRATNDYSSGRGPVGPPTIDGQPG